jgi:hypothetical protein
VYPATQAHEKVVDTVDTRARMLTWTTGTVVDNYTTNQVTFNSNKRLLKLKVSFKMLKDCPQDDDDDGYVSLNLFDNGSR